MFMLSVYGAAKDIRGFPEVGFKLIELNKVVIHRIFPWSEIINTKGFSNDHNNFRGYQ